MEFKKFLEGKYLDWQRASGGRKTVLEFANYLGVSQQSVSNWWNGDRIPQGENIKKLADKLGLEVYDVLGLSRPNPDLHYLQGIWDELSPEEQRILRETAVKYVTRREQQSRRIVPKRRVSSA